MPANVNLPLPETGNDKFYTLISDISKKIIYYKEYFV